MEDLKSVLGAGTNWRRPVADGNESWNCLARKIDELRQQDMIKTETLRMSKWIEFDCSLTSVDAIISRCISTIHDISWKSESPFAVIPADCKDICDTLVEDLAHLNAIGHLCRRDFAHNLLNIKHPVPLELIWMLHKVGILQISTYIFRKFPAENETRTSSSVLWLLQNSAKSLEYVQIVIDVFASVLVASNHSGALNPHLSTICAAFWRKCTEEIIDHVQNSSKVESKSTESGIDFAYLPSMALKAACGEEAVQHFAFTHLLYFLNEQSVPNNIQAVGYAVTIQQKISLDNVSLSLKSLLLSVAITLGGQRVINKLRVAVVSPRVNWRNVLLLTTAVIAEDPKSCDVLKTLTDELIVVGLEKGRQTELSAGLLLARQCCNCDNKTFSTYSVWFSSKFGPNSVTARSTFQFRSLLQLLTDIVPFESAEMLRVHINKVPQAPTSCHNILRDYTELARTRLTDLNESTELAGLFCDSKGDSFLGLDSRQSDLVKVLQHFQQTKEVMKPVLEASMFRRQYYRNIFLVELLGLPGSTSEALNLEEFGLTSEIRHEFIELLRSLEKIPDKLFKLYTDLKSEQTLVANTESILSKEFVMETKPESSGLFNKKKSLQVKQKKKVA